MLKGTGKVITRIMAAMAALSGLAGCALQIPADPNSTLDQVRNGTLRVGVTPAPPIVDITKAVPSGPGVTLVQEFAENLDAEVEWKIDGEEALVNLLAEGKIDVALGGFTSETPWSDKAAVTREYDQLTGFGGKGIVMLVPAGENAFLAELETFLDSQVTQ